MKRFFGDLGERIVFVVKRQMDRQRGFGNDKKYKKLKIKWRYHGRKELVASKRNMARRIRGTGIRETTIKGKNTKLVSVADKTKVTASTVILQDMGDLKRSWDVLKFDEGRVEVGPLTPAEKEKAYYNDDRGNWDWGTKSIPVVEKEFLGYLDKHFWDK